MTEQYNLDPELFFDFVSATEESLSGLDELFIQLENDPGDLAIVQEIFRPVHSIKGNAAFFNLGNMKTLAHDLENLIDKIRKEILRADKPIIDTILTGTDLLSQMLQRVKNGEAEVADQQVYDDLIKRIEEAGSGSDLLQDYIQFVEKTMSFTEFVKDEMVDRNTSEDNLTRIIEYESFCQDAYNAHFSSAGSEEDMQSFSTDTILEIDGVPVQEELIFLSEMLGSVWESEPSEDESARLKEAIVGLREKLGDNHEGITKQMQEDYSTFADSPLGLDDALRQCLKTKYEELLQYAQRVNNAQDEADIAVQVKEASGKNKIASKKTMRIEESKIDQFMKFVSELVILSEAFKHVRTDVSARLENAESKKRLSATVDQFQTLSEHLQSAILSVRTIAAHQLTQKFPRMVRDLATNLGKKAIIEISGEDVNLDKSLIDALDAPMTHLLRNCLDHGIETPETRKKSGKSETGTVRIEIEKKDDFATIRIEDDGKGIDPEVMKRKAVDAGWMSAEEAEHLSPYQAQMLIFRSGFSTAQQVSDVSGRGVGMDVVHTEIENLGGRIELESAVGEGTTLSLSIPVNITTIVSRVMVAKVGNQIVSVPEEQVMEVVSIKEDQYHNMGASEVVHIRGKVFQVLRANELLFIGGEKRPLQDGALFLLNEKRRNVALFVDEVKNLQQVIVRKPDGDILDEEVISGIGVHGDGSLSQVLDFAMTTS